MTPRALMVDVDGVLVRNPDPGGWSAHLEQDLGLFIDDSERNVQAAVARGWRARLWSPGLDLSVLFPELLQSE